MHSQTKANLCWTN